MKNVVLIGIQGSGKGTQAKMLRETCGLTHINLGEIFRQNIKDKTELGHNISEFIAAGMLVPDHLVFKVIDAEVNKSSRGVIIDGFPRNINQSEYLLKNLKMDAIIYFNLAIEHALKRLTSRRICSVCGADYNLFSKPPKKENICDVCGNKLITRLDDTPELISKRFELFESDTKPVIDYFREKNMLMEIDANQSPVEIHELIIKKIYPEKYAKSIE
ncbi:MAG: nucleoside monophosphate kinase [Candidatus Cloacimonetes bacterium]|nr:nucleoside monophosphate kinase [Candidatus Cloacimonadota bacterium]